MSKLLPDNLKYFNISKNWKVLGPIYESPEIVELAFTEMNAYIEARAEQHGFKYKEDRRCHYPRWFDSCDWRFDRKGRPPIFDKWICHSACHWTANINAEVIMKAQPTKNWRVINSSYHSTVWDGKNTIYDTNFYGLKIPIEDVVEGINNSDDLEMWEVGFIPYH